MGENLENACDANGDLLHYDFDRNYLVVNCMLMEREKTEVTA